MMFKDNLIAVIRCQGRIMREDKGEVRLPFGSDYSILIKNKESRKAVVSVEIDGQDVLGGSELIVSANSETELKGFLEGNVARNAFRFIRKTQEIVDYRGDRVDDGIVRVGFRFEKEVVDAPIIHHTHHWEHHYHWDHYPWWQPRRDIVYGAGDLLRSSNSSGIGPNSVSINNALSKGEMTTCYHSQSVELLRDEGITVKGAEVNQGFVTGHTRELESQEHVITLVLKGYAPSGIPVAEPIAVQTKRQCSSCGKRFPSSVSFCATDGTALA